MFYSVCFYPSGDWKERLSGQSRGEKLRNVNSGVIKVK